MDVMFKIILLAAAIIIALGWGVYGVWWYMTFKSGKAGPRESSQRLQDARKSMQDYAEKMKTYKRKRYEREDERDSS
jgi:hypothetical protein